MNIFIASFGSYLIESSLSSLLVTTEHVDSSSTRRRDQCFIRRHIIKLVNLTPFHSTQIITLKKRNRSILWSQTLTCSKTYARICSSHQAVFPIQPDLHIFLSEFLGMFPVITTRKKCVVLLNVGMKFHHCTSRIVNHITLHTAFAHIFQEQNFLMLSAPNKSFNYSMKKIIGDRWWN